jgi:hypothetical protein
LYLDYNANLLDRDSVLGMLCLKAVS